MKTFILILTCVAVLLPSSADASIWTLNVGGNETTGSGANAIANDAIVMSFDDSVGPNKVRLTINFQGGAGVDASAFLNDLVFSVSDALSGFTFSYVSGVVTHLGSPTHSMNAQSLSPKSGFDILFNYPPPTGKPKFFVGMTSTYDITATGVNSNSFDFMNVANEFKAFVHINAVDNGNSGKFGNTVNQVVPEPTALTIWLGTMLGSLAIVRFRSRR